MSTTDSIEAIAFSDAEPPGSQTRDRRNARAVTFSRYGSNYSARRKTKLGAVAKVHSEKRRTAEGRPGTLGAAKANAKPARAFSVDSVQPDGRVSRVIVREGLASTVTRNGKRPARPAGLRRNGSDSGSRIRFLRKQEYLGTVAEIDEDAQAAVVTLIHKAERREDEVIATLPFDLFADEQLERMLPGSVFTLVTGFEQHLNAGGAVIKSAQQAKVYFQAPRRLSARRRSQAYAEADAFFED